MEFNCSTLIKSKQGEAYCHEYDNYLNFFHMLACSDTQITCKNVPQCWIPFVAYLGHKVVSIKNRWDCDNTCWDNFYNDSKDKRRVVEIASSCRPELVHALYCADTEWPCLLKEKHEHQKEFLVTCNASFFRPEVEHYRKEILGKFIAPKQKAVIVPCAASKPYPAPLHKEVKKVLQRAVPYPDQWHIITATGVLGLIPEELWKDMPHYDSGLPNILRCAQTVAWYFTKHRYTHICIYSDFYAYAVRLGLDEANWEGYRRFVMGIHYRDTYSNLMLKEHLQDLEEALVSLEKGKGDE